MAQNGMRKAISVAPDSAHCSTCALSELCLPLGMTPEQRIKLDQLITKRIQVKKTDALFHLGDKVQAVYAIRSGSIKTQLEDAAGRTQITGFLLPGEIAGLDGLIELQQPSHAIAMEKCVHQREVQLLDLDALRELAGASCD